MVLDPFSTILSLLTPFSFRFVLATRGLEIGESHYHRYCECSQQHRFRPPLGYNSRIQEIALHGVRYGATRALTIAYF